MSGIIIAFAKKNNAERIRNILKTRGYDVRSICSTVSGALTAIQSMESGIIISGVMLSDGHCTELAESISGNFKLIVTGRKEDLEDIVINRPGFHKLPSPFTVSELISEINSLTADSELPPGSRTYAKPELPPGSKLHTHHGSARTDDLRYNEDHWLRSNPNPHRGSIQTARGNCAAPHVASESVKNTSSELHATSTSKTSRSTLSESERKTLYFAKQLLMSKLNMTEQEAHRYIQKQSMNHKLNKFETARLIIRNLKSV